MATGLVETKRESFKMQNMNVKNQDVFDPLLIPGDDEKIEVQQAQKGELSTFVLHISNLLNDNVSRQLTYLALTFIALFPTFVDSLHVIEDGSFLEITNKVPFCDDTLSCYLGLLSCILMYLPLFILYFMITKFNLRKQAGLKLTCIACLIIGNLSLTVTVIYMTVKSNTNPDRICFLLTENGDFYCRLSYFGNNCIAIMMGWLAIIDILNITKSKKPHFYLSLRLKAFACLLILSSSCIVINLFEHGDKYVNGNKFTWIALVICCIGYVMIIAISLFAFLMFECLKWNYKQKVGDSMSKLLFIAVLCIQTRTYADTFVFSIVGLIMSIDIQVLKEMDL